MEWVNITAKSLPEAIDLALDNLGVDEAEAEIEVLEEPKQGLFGRTRGNARVKARVRPKESRPKVERGQRRRRSEGAGGGEGRTRNKRPDSSGRNGGDDSQKKSNESGERSGRPAGSEADKPSGDSSNKARANKERPASAPAKEVSVEEVSTQVESFLSGLVEAFGVEGGVRIDSDGEEGIIGVIEGQHGLMIGPKGRTLESIQELARVTAQRSAPSSIRIKVDVGGYREMRADALQKFAAKVAAEALGDGSERSMEPMSSADRKIVHDALNDVAGIETRSAGNEPRRRVVVVPVGFEDDTDVADASDDSDAVNEAPMGEEDDGAADVASDDGETSEAVVD